MTALDGTGRPATGSLTGQVAVVTGGIGGIGRAIVDVLAADGADVIAADVVPDTVDVAAEMFAGTMAAPGAGVVRGQVLDVSDPAQVDAFVRACRADHGRLDILINNAGVGGSTEPVWETSLDRWDRDIAIMLTGPFLLCRAVLPLMIERGYGRIVNIASMAGKEGNPNSAPYSSAKAGLIGLTKVVGKEVATTGVLVNAVAPGVVESPMNHVVSREFHEYVLTKIPMGRPGRPAELAELVHFLSSPRLGFSTGAVFDFSGGRATY